MISIKRPGTGLGTKYLNKIIGLKLKKNVMKDHIYKIRIYDEKYMVLIVGTGSIGKRHIKNAISLGIGPHNTCS